MRKYLYLVGTALIFGSMEVVSKYPVRFCDPFALTAWRFAVGYAFLLVYARALSLPIKRGNRRDRVLLALAGLLNCFISMSLLQAGVKYGSPSAAATIFCSNPLFVYLLSLLFGEERFSFRRFLGVLMGVGGVAAVFCAKLSASLGNLLAAASALTFALFTVLTKQLSGKFDVISLSVLSFPYGIAGAFAYLLLTSPREALLPHEVLAYPGVLHLLYLGAVVSGIGYVFFMETIKSFSPVGASSIFLLKPAIASLLSYALLGEPLSPTFLAGMGLVVTGSYFLLSPSTSRNSATREELPQTSETPLTGRG